MTPLTQEWAQPLVLHGSGARRGADLRALGLHHRHREGDAVCGIPKVWGTHVFRFGVYMTLK